MKLICACDDKGGIGKDGRIPWHIPEDLKRFKQLTMRQTCIMGRKTLDSLPDAYRPLPNRHSIVVTNQQSLLDRSIDGEGGMTTIRFLSLWDAFVLAPEQTWVIGGASVYAEALALCLIDEIHLTRVRGDFDCDVFFPGVPEGWRRVSVENPAGHSALLGEPAYRFEVWKP